MTQPATAGGASGSSVPPPASIRVDLRGLLVALVLVPQSYPRNRFYELYRQPAAHRTRRRAALLRGVIADLTQGAGNVTIERGDGYVVLRYRLEDVGVSRMSRIDDDELAVVKLALERSGRSHALDPVDEDALQRIRPHLRSLFHGS